MVKEKGIFFFNYFPGNRSVRAATTNPSRGKGTGGDETSLLSFKAKKEGKGKG